ncbi:TPA: hypothetical protein ACH9V4_001058, partial [Escherichia coli]
RDLILQLSKSSIYSTKPNGSVAALLVALFNLGIATLIYLPFVVVANKAQNAIDKEESEEDIANALKF